MNEQAIELLVRLACGESNEPPLQALVRVDGTRYRVWKHGARLRVETEDGGLRAIREPERVLTFAEDDDVPVESGPGSFAFDGDGDASHALLARPSLRELDLDERCVVGQVERGERFGRPTATITLGHTYHDAFEMTLVLDAVTGMPLEIVEAGSVLLQWLELEVVSAVDESRLRWDGPTRSAGWFAYVGSSDGELDETADVPEAVREQFRENARRSAELSASFDHSPLVARVPLVVRVDSDPDHVAIDVEADVFVSVRGRATANREDMRPDAEVWSTPDGWTWTVSGSGVEDSALVVALRERVIAWRAGLAGDDG